jgi:hypothetical protein
MEGPLPPNGSGCREVVPEPFFVARAILRRTYIAVRGPLLKPCPKTFCVRVPLKIQTWNSGRRLLRELVSGVKDENE